MSERSHAKSARAVRRLTRAREFGIFLFLLAVYLLLFVLKPRFRDPEEQLRVACQFSWIAIIAVGMTMVIITAGIDLSVGSVLALAACCMGKLVEFEVNVWLAVAAGLLVGAACGLLNGLAITRLRIPPFIATLGMMGMARGMTYVITKGWYRNLPRNLVKFLGEGEALQIPVPVWIMGAVAIAGSLLVRHTTIGRYIYAIGGNEEAARLSGIKVNRVKLVVYALTGFLAALAGMIVAARSGSAQPSAGVGSELSVIAAVIVGGTSLMGGEGSVLGTVIGAAILGVIPCGLILFGFPPEWELVAVGMVIIVAVALDQLKKR
jgi:ribose transport system permease protein